MRSYSYYGIPVLCSLNLVHIYRSNGILLCTAFSVDKEFPFLLYHGVPNTIQNILCCCMPSDCGHADTTTSVPYTYRHVTV
jgi:hypothetical protein